MYLLQSNTKSIHNPRSSEGSANSTELGKDTISLFSSGKITFLDCYKDLSAVTKNIDSSSRVFQSPEICTALEKIFWSDKIKIDLFGRHNSRHIWRKVDTSYDPQNIILSNNHNDRSMILCIFSKSGIEPISSHYRNVG